MSFISMFLYKIQFLTSGTHFFRPKYRTIPSAISSFHARVEVTFVYPSSDNSKIMLRIQICSKIRLAALTFSRDVRNISYSPSPGSPMDTSALRYAIGLSNTTFPDIW